MFCGFWGADMAFYQIQQCLYRSHPLRLWRGSLFYNQRFFDYQNIADQQGKNREQRDFDQVCA
jgi:hypothetical protein